MSVLRLVPVSRRDAQRFIARYHRHNAPRIMSVFNVGVADESGLVGVAMADLPTARMLVDGYTLELKPGIGWARNGGHGDYDMFGNERLPQGMKRRWRRIVA